MKRSFGPNSGFARTRSSTTVTSPMSCWICSRRAGPHRIFAVVAGYAGQIYESCRSGPVLHNALGCVQQVFQTHTQRRTGLSDKCRKVVDVSDDLFGRKITRQGEVTRLVNKGMCCPNFSVSLGVFMDRSYSSLAFRSSRLGISIV